MIATGGGYYCGCSIVSVGNESARKMVILPLNGSIGPAAAKAAALDDDDDDLLPSIIFLLQFKQINSIFFSFLF